MFITCWICGHARGDVIIVRYADDSVVGFTTKEPSRPSRWHCSRFRSTFRRGQGQSPIGLQRVHLHPCRFRSTGTVGQRLTVADLPVTVELGDADAMMLQMKLSNFPEIQLVARISRAGQPAAGEWSVQSASLPKSAKTLQKLIIDTPKSIRRK